MIQRSGEWDRGSVSAEWFEWLFLFARGEREKSREQRAQMRFLMGPDGPRRFVFTLTITVTRVQRSLTVIFSRPIAAIFLLFCFRSPFDKTLQFVNWTINNDIARLLKIIHDTISDDTARFAILAIIKPETSILFEWEPEVSAFLFCRRVS